MTPLELTVISPLGRRTTHAPTQPWVTLGRSTPGCAVDVELPDPRINGVALVFGRVHGLTVLLAPPPSPRFSTSLRSCILEPRRHAFDVYDCTVVVAVPADVVQVAADAGVYVVRTERDGGALAFDSFVGDDVVVLFDELAVARRPGGFWAWVTPDGASLPLQAGKPHAFDGRPRRVVDLLVRDPTSPARVAAPGPGRFGPFVVGECLQRHTHHAVFRGADAATGAPLVCEATTLVPAAPERRSLAGCVDAVVGALPPALRARTRVHVDRDRVVVAHDDVGGPLVDALLARRGPAPAATAWAVCADLLRAARVAAGLGDVFPLAADVRLRAFQIDAAGHLVWLGPGARPSPIAADERERAAPALFERAAWERFSLGRFRAPFIFADVAVDVRAVVGGAVDDALAALLPGIARGGVDDATLAAIDARVDAGARAALAAWARAP